MQFGPNAILGMVIRGTPVRRLWRATRLVQREGLPITLAELEAHLLAGGDIERVLEAALEARRRGLPDNLRALTAADLVGEDLNAFLNRRYVFKAELERQRLWSEAPDNAQAARELAELLRSDIQRCQQQIDGCPDAKVIGDDLRGALLSELTKVIERRKAELTQVGRWLVG